MLIRSWGGNLASSTARQLKNLCPHPKRKCQYLRWGWSTPIFCSNRGRVINPLVAVYMPIKGIYYERWERGPIPLFLELIDTGHMWHQLSVEIWLWNFNNRPPTPPQVWMTPTFLWAWNYYVNAIPSTAKYSQTRRFVTCPIIQVWGKHFEGKSKHWKPWKSVGQHDARCHGAKTGIENQHFKTTKFTNLQVTLQQLCLEQFSKETNPKCSKDLAYWPRFG